MVVLLTWRDSRTMAVFKTRCGTTRSPVACEKARVKARCTKQSDCVAADGAAGSDGITDQQPTVRQHQQQHAAVTPNDVALLLLYNPLHSPFIQPCYIITCSIALVAAHATHSLAIKSARFLCNRYHHPKCGDCNTAQTQYCASCAVLLREVLSTRSCATPAGARCSGQYCSPSLAHFAAH
jgi:hypothetical protein